MNLDLLDLLCCPDCRAPLSLDNDALRCTQCTSVYPIVDGIPRFVPAENYAASFGFQWNRFPRTQLDSSSGVPVSRDRFFSSTVWTADELRGKRVLDAGSGSGRFAEIALSAGARLVAIDYSAAVDAARANLGASKDLDVVQADMFRLPFREGTFDYVYSLGVLQHTPDPERAFRSLLPMLRSGGKIVIDVYPKTWMNLFWPKYWFRPITRRMRGERLFRIVERLVPVLLPISRILGRIPLLGRKLRWLVPVANYEGIHPLSDAQIREWAVLDTFDMFSPAHDHPQSAATLRRWLDEAGLASGEVVKSGHLVARARKN
ncbi:MAG TPA: methyltransferase domain-containing protein [Thermoanaerobaculia bacterium]|nr:methyltransferase domain-containing protein [Thermoanaerobaculia bacterium]